MKSEEGIQISDFTNELGMIPLREVASVNEVTINPKSLDWLNYTDISSVGVRTVETPLMVSGQDAPSRARRVLRNGDTVISTVRPNRKSYFIFRDNWDRAIASTGFVVISPKNFQDSEYLHAVLTTDAATAHYESLCEGGAYPAFNPHAIENMQIPWPSPQERELIGSLSSAILQKIETNVRLSNSLESIARVIFKSWFIDFDPVKAKMAGEKPVGIDDAAAALFPDSMEDSELGPVPTNWQAVPLTDLFDVLGGGTPKTTEKSFWGGAIPWFSVVDAPESGGCFFIKTEKTITELGVSKSAAKIVRPGVTIISARGTVGKTAIVASPSTFNQSCYGLMGKYGDFYTYLLVKYMVSKLQNIAHGGMFDTITRDTFSALTVPKPMELIIQAFEKLVEPMFMQVRNLQYQSEQLATMLDALLPRLILGELQIPEEMLVS
jgi:restriction endonuclease S subunit